MFRSSSESPEAPDSGRESPPPPAPPPSKNVGTGPAAPHDAAQGRRFDRRRTAWLGAAVSLLVATSLWFCWLQPVHPDAYRVSEPTSWEWWSQPVEINAPARLPRLPRVDLHRAFFRGLNGWVVGDLGLILHTQDGGASWQRQDNVNWDPPIVGLRQRTARILNAVTFIDAKRGWAVGEVGLLLATSDGGKSWAAQESGTIQALKGVHFVNATRGWAVGEWESRSGQQALLTTSDAGRTWTRVPLLVESYMSLNAVVFVDETTGFIVGENGLLLKTSNAGASWEPIALLTRSDLVTATHIGGGVVWCAGENGSLVRLETNRAVTEFREFSIEPTASDKLGRDALAANRAITQGSSEAHELVVTSLQFTDSDNGWAVGKRGESYRTRDGGATWARVETGTTADLYGSALIAPDRLIAFGADGTALVTSTNASRWYASSQRTASPGSDGSYRRFPAPLYYLGLLGVAALFVVAYRQKRTVEKITVPRASIADHAVADRPLGEGDFDALNFGPLVEGLADFLHNKNTTGPLTLAITGAWGSGKSSVMGLLKSRLTAKGFRPVWFNAWHHQAEDQLLAGLLDSIRTQAVPPLLSLSGLNFRCRLINVRLRRQWIPLGATTLLLGAAAAVVHHFNPELSVGAASDLGGNDGATWTAKVAELIASVFASSDGATWTAKIAALVASIFATYKLYEGLRAFGVDPGKLLASVTKTASLSDLGAQTSLRHRFAREFEEVTTALQPHTMTVFIDDLDRCEPSQVMEVLKSLNFLATSGQCFLIIGMEETAVTNAVATSLEEQFKTREGQALDETESLRKRWDYAQLWMEKLIQIRIAVPTANHDQYQDLLVGREAQQPQSYSRFSRGLQGVKAGLRSLGDAFGPITPLVLALTLGVPGFLATKVLLPGPAAEAPKSAVVPPPNDTSATSATPSIPSPTASLQPAREASAGETLDRDDPNYGDVYLPLTPGQTARPPWWVATGLLAVLGLASMRLLYRYYYPVTDDSEDFRQALRRWSGYIFDAHQTPRAAKRLINKLRLYAMLMRARNQQVGAGHVAESTIVAFGILENSFASKGDDSPGDAITDLTAEQRADFDQLLECRRESPELFRQFLPLVKMDNEMRESVTLAQEVPSGSPPDRNPLARRVRVRKRAEQAPPESQPDA